MRNQTAGLPGMEPACTLEEASLQLGVTRERVRQIEASALQKARAILQQRGITPAMFLDQWHRSARTD
jgi:DNA-directed RNA polymerase sigma subunit (sigma70/sigma32)